MAVPDRAAPVPRRLAAQLQSLSDGVGVARWMIRLLAQEEVTGVTSDGPFVTLHPRSSPYDLIKVSIEWTEGGSASVAGVSDLRVPLPWREGAVVMVRSHAAGTVHLQSQRLIHRSFVRSASAACCACCRTAMVATPPAMV